MPQKSLQAGSRVGATKGAWLGGLTLLFIIGLVVDRWTEDAGRPLALAEAQRIWLDQEGEPSALREPTSFWAIRDFALSAEQLERGAASATLVLIGDPGIVVYWNGLLVHSSEYRLGQPVYRLKVGPLLEERNRVVLEGRSGQGGGGLLAALWLNEPESASGDATNDEPLWVTDQRWQTTKTFNADVLSGLLPLSALSDLAPAKAWSSLDLGRWQPLRMSEDQLEASWPSQRLEIIAPSSRSIHTAEPYQEGESEPWPSGVLLTFEETVQGCLGLAGRDLFSRRVFFFENPATFRELKGPREYAQAQGQVWSNRSERVVAVRGATSWFDTEARSFRAVFLEGPVTIDAKAELDGSTTWVQRCAGSQLSAPVQRLSLSSPLGVKPD